MLSAKVELTILVLVPLTNTAPPSSAAVLLAKVEPVMLVPLPAI